MAMRRVVDAFCRVVRRGWPLLLILLAVCAPSPVGAADQLHIVSRWSGNAAEHYFWNGAQWQGWNVIGGKTILSPPALVSYQGNVHVFAVADDQRLYHAVWNGSSWSGWFDFGGPFATNAGAAAVDYYGYLIVLAVTPDNRLLMTWFDPSTGKWADYAPFAINIFGRPAMTMHNGDLHFLVRGSDDDYHHRVWNAQTQSLSAWFHVGGPFVAGGAIASFGGQLHIFGSSNGGELFQVVNLTQFINRGAPPGTQVVGSPAVANFADSALVVLVRGANNGLYGQTLSGGLWSGYSSSFGQALTGPATTFHRTGGGGGANRPPVLRQLLTTRAELSFGKDDAFRTGIGGQPNVQALKTLLAPRIVLPDPTLIDAAKKLPSCCTLLIADGPADPDGDPINFHWLAGAGTFYSTGDDGSGGIAFGGMIPDIGKYNRNTVFYESHSIMPFPPVGNAIQGGSTDVEVHLTDVPRVGQPLASAKDSVTLSYGMEVHLEVALLSSRQLPMNHPHYPGAFVMTFVAIPKGDFAVGAPVTLRIDCGARAKDRMVDVTLLQEPLGPFDCIYPKEDEGRLTSVAVVASVGQSAGFPPFAFPLADDQLNFFRALGCTIGDVLPITVKADKQEACNEQQFAGSDTPETHQIEMGTKSGTFVFDWTTFTQKDRIVVSYEGQTLFDSGCVGGSGSETLTYSSGVGTKIRVQVFPNCQGGTGTQWNFTAHCPK